MATISLRVCIVDKDLTKTMQFDPSTSVYDACRLIREKIIEARVGEGKYLYYCIDLDVKLSTNIKPAIFTVDSFEMQHQPTFIFNLTQFCSVYLQIKKS